MRRRKRAIVETPIETADGQGGVTVVWQEAFRAWVAIEPVSVRENLMAGGPVSGITHRVGMRYKPGQRVTAGSRFRVDETRIFRVDGPPINVDEKNRRMVFTCQEVA